MKQKLFFIILFVFSLVIRIFFGLKTEFNADHLQIYNLGYDLYHNHIIPAYGAAVVYTDTKLLGSFQGFLAAIGLVFSKGNPYGLIYFVQLYNAFACLVIYFIYKNIFPKFNKYYLFVFIMFLPLNFMVSSAWNPAFIPLLSSLYLYGLLRILNHKTDFYSYFLLLFPHLLIFQLNLQFIILVGLTIILFCLKIIPIPKVKYVLLSQIPGLLFLIPTFIDKCKNISNITENITSQPDLIQNIQFHPERVFDFFQVLFKFISFGTGEMFRLHYYPIHNYVVWPIFIFALSINAGLFLIGFLFYCRKETWDIKTGLKSSTTLQKLDFIVLIIPFLTTALFVFSVIKMKLHTIWILFPFAFYPIFRMISLKQSFLQNVPRVKSTLFIGFMISTLISSYIEMDKYPTQFIHQYKNAKETCSYKITDPQKYEFYVQQSPEKIRVVTISLCRYFEENI